METAAARRVSAATAGGRKPPCPTNLPGYLFTLCNHRPIFHFLTNFCMKLILFLPAAGLLFAGMVRPAPTIGTGSVQTPVSQPEEAFVKPSASMWADRTTLRRNQTLTLYFTTPHPQYLGVVDPDGNFFYVVFPEEYSTGELKPLVGSTEFVQMNTLKIKPACLKADPYRHGIWKNQPVFTKSGTYRFLLGDNLHVDDENALTIVKIKYKHKAATRRPAPNADIAAL
jgi:hypothetical protein